MLIKDASWVFFYIYCQRLQTVVFVADNVVEVVVVIVVIVVVAVVVVAVVAVALLRDMKKMKKYFWSVAKVVF